MLFHDTVGSLTDDELLGRTSDLVRQTRRSEASLIAHMGEVDARRLYLREGAASMFLYATRVLHLSEAEAYLRITVARAAREHPDRLGRRFRAHTLHRRGRIRHRKPQWPRSQPLRLLGVAGGRRHSRRENHRLNR